MTNKLDSNRMFNPAYCPECGQKATLEKFYMADPTFFQMRCTNLKCKLDIFTTRYEYSKNSSEHIATSLITLRGSNQ